MATEKRLINANALMDTLKKRTSTAYLNELWGLMLAQDFVEDAPTVDAVEVVRCKDCKHWKHIAHVGCSDLAKVCMLANYMIGANGYCLYGERKDND